MATAIQTELKRHAGSGSIQLSINGDRIAMLTIDQPEKKVNVMDVAFIADLDAALRALDPNLAGLVVGSAKKDNFIAGADLDQLLQAETAEQAAAVVRSLHRVLNRLAELPFPSVAAINGAALGGGLEVALACDYRVVVESEKPILGLPEIQLGILPAGGGCQRLPRLIGLSRALGLILEGKRYNSRRAKRYGVVDDVVHPAILIPTARSLLPRGKRTGHPKWSWLDRAAEASPAIRALIFKQAARAVHSRTGGHYPAPLKALDAVRAGAEQGFGAGLASEAVAFGDLSVGTVAHNLIGLFLAGEEMKREQRALTAAAHPVSAVGVVGTGFMGSGIAQTAATSGFTTRVRDAKPEQVGRGLKKARDLTESAARKGRFSRQEARAALARLSGTTDYSGFKRADIVIEAIFEDVALKRAVIAELEEVLDETAVIASNTSSLPIGSLAADARIPERIVGMHFFSPVHKMPLVEVIRGERSSEHAIATSVEVGRAMGKTVIVVSDGPGFFTTRVISFMVQQAGALFEEGASVEAIDSAMRAFGFPVGPLALSDEVGLDVGSHVARILASAFPDRFGPSPAMQRMVEEGRLGRKRGRGFYDYSGRKKKVDQSIYGARSNPPREFPRASIQERLVLAFVNEAAHCLSEAVIASARDGDIGSVMGIGFPPFLGGPFRYADSLGIDAVLEKLQHLKEAHGPAFRPASIWSQLLESNARFHTQ